MSAVGNALKSILNDKPLTAVQAKAAVYLGRYAEKKHLGKQAIKFYKKGLKLIKQLPSAVPDPAKVKSKLLKKLNKNIKKVKKRMKRRAEAKRKKTRAGLTK